jgi:hypothetical protein
MLPINGREDSIICRGQPYRGRACYNISLLFLKFFIELLRLVQGSEYDKCR